MIKQMIVGVVVIALCALAGIYIARMVGSVKDKVVAHQTAMVRL
jgi:hypothetical protein